MESGRQFCFGSWDLEYQAVRPQPSGASGLKAGRFTDSGL